MGRDALSRRSYFAKTERNAGYWKALDDVLSEFNSFDTAGLTGDQAKIKLYGTIMDMRPK